MDSRVVECARVSGRDPVALNLGLDTPCRSDLGCALALDRRRRGGPCPRARHGLPEPAPDSGTPAAAALARQSASSTDDTRAAAVAVRRSETRAGLLW